MNKRDGAVVIHCLTAIIRLEILLKVWDVLLGRTVLSIEKRLLVVKLVKCLASRRIGNRECKSIGAHLFLHRTAAYEIRGKYKALL